MSGAHVSMDHIIRELTIPKWAAANVLVAKVAQGDMVIEVGRHAVEELPDVHCMSS